MPEQEPTPSKQDVDAEQRFKTLALRVDESLHAQISFIARLGGRSLRDELRLAIEQRVITAGQDPELIEPARKAREDMEREAASRGAALTGFLGGVATADAPTPPRRASRRRNAPKV